MPNRIAELRKEKGMTLKALGDAVGLKDNTISQYEKFDENGKAKREPKLDTWKLLARALGVSVPYLQGISDDPTPIPFSQVSITAMADPAFLARYPELKNIRHSLFYRRASSLLTDYHSLAPDARQLLIENVHADGDELTANVNSLLAKIDALPDPDAKK